MMKGQLQVSSRFEYAIMGVAFVGIIALALGAGPLVRNLYLTLVVPIQNGSEYAGLSKDALIERLRTAESSLKTVGFQSALMAELAHENQELRKLAGAREKSEGVVGRVIARPPRTLYDTILVDVGVAEGVRVRDVVHYEGAYLGDIVSAESGSSLARLASSPGATRDALVGTPRAVSIAKGLGGGAYELSVSREVEVAPGDPILFAENESFLIGIVAHVAEDPSKTTKLVYFRSPVSISDLEFVEIEHSILPAFESAEE